MEFIDSKKMDLLIRKYSNWAEEFTNKNMRRCASGDITFRDYDKNLSIDSSRAVFLSAWLNNRETACQTRTAFLTLFTLEDVLLKSSLFREERAELFLYVISENINIGLLSSKMDNSIDLKYHWKNFKMGLNKKKVIGLRGISNENFYRFGFDYAVKLYFSSSHSPNKIGDFQRMVFDRKQFGEICNLHYIIKNHYLDIPNDFTRGDVLAIKLVLLNFELSSELVNSIEMYLMGKIIARERKIKEEKQKIALRKKRELEAKRPLRPVIIPKVITPKEIKDTLSEYYDFDNNQAITYLSLDEIVYCICLLRRLDYNREMIDVFIRKAVEYDNSCDEINPITRFLKLKEKILFYKSRGELELIDILAEIDEAFSHIFIAGDDDFAFYKSYIGSELKTAINTIGSKTEYEHLLADGVEDELFKEKTLRHKKLLK